MGWCGIALALREPEEDHLASRIPTYLHPLAGRSLAWHVLHALASLDPPANRLVLVGAPELHPAATGELPSRLVAPHSRNAWWAQVEAELPPECSRLLVVDAAAPALGPGLECLVSGPPNRALRGENGSALALWLELADAGSRWSGRAALDEAAVGLEDADCGNLEGAFAVRDRAALARAAAIIRNRTVARLMAGGATFLSPESVIVDVDVRVGPDTVIYPGVVLEGQTTIGAETVVGPSCRLIDAEVGSGVELKGWNYIVRSRIRNRAVLEPYVRRGFD